MCSNTFNISLAKKLIQVGHLTEDVTKMFDKIESARKVWLLLRKYKSL